MVEGLADDCPRCDEIALAPHIHMDAVNWALIIDRVNNNLPARSNAEQRAMAKIELAIAVMKRNNENTFSDGRLRKEMK